MTSAAPPAKPTTPGVVPTLDGRLAALESSILPTWVYDHAGPRFRWANRRAVAFWRAEDRAELLSRDLSGLSEPTRVRLEGYLRAIAEGEDVEEDWTLYPRGVPATVTLHGSGVALDDGRTAILFQALERPAGFDASMVRGVESIRHSSMMISLVDGEGRILFHNPAALRAFGDAPMVGPLFAGEEVARAIRATVGAAGPWAGEARALTLAGERTHAVEARPTTDPVSGTPAALVQQLDVSAQRQAEGRVAAQQAVIDELNRSLALVEQQRREILALSAPLLDVGTAALAAPLIGRLDRERAEELSERLPAAIVARGARDVILDLTGTHGVDPEGAAALLAAVRAVELLGARVVLAGIRPEVARALVDRGDVMPRGVRLARSLRDALGAISRDAL